MIKASDDKKHLADQAVYKKRKAPLDILSGKRFDELTASDKELLLKVLGVTMGLIRPDDDA